jgi:hypothetical protein
MNAEEKQLMIEAWRVQDACNASGVARSMVRATEVLWQLARAGSHGTEWVNRHPVMTLYVSKLASLNGLAENESRAFELAAKEVDGEEVVQT